MKHYLLILLLSSAFGFYGTSQDTDNDGVQNFADNDADNDGILDVVECGSNTSSINVTGDINATATGGYPVSIEEPGNTANGTGAAGIATTSGTVKATLGNGDTFEGCEVQMSVGSFDDGIIVEINGVVILQFTQTNYQNQTEFNATGKFGNGTQPWVPWTGIGNPELVITDGVIELLLDNSSGQRENMIPFLQNSGADIVTRNIPFQIDCLNGFDFLIGNTNTGGGAAKITDVSLSINLFVCNDSDGDGISNNLDLDSDNDGCYDVKEAGHSDSDEDGYLGTSPITVNQAGEVENQGGYSGTNSSVTSSGPDSDGDGIADACDDNTVEPEPEPEIPTEPLVFEPVNIFTPNNDGANDVFTFSEKASGVAEFKCTILNRWGVIVFEMDNITTSWNGQNLNGNNCGNGVYFYLYEGVGQNGTAFSGQGTVTLIE